MVCGRFCHRIWIGPKEIASLAVDLNKSIEFINFPFNRERYLVMVMAM